MMRLLMSNRMMIEPWGLVVVVAAGMALGIMPAAATPVGAKTGSAVGAYLNSGSPLCLAGALDSPVALLLEQDHIRYKSAAGMQSGTTRRAGSLITYKFARNFGAFVSPRGGPSRGGLHQTITVKIDLSQGPPRLIWSLDRPAGGGNGGMSADSYVPKVTALRLCTAAERAQLGP